jgi:hypothetical protein
MATSWIPEDDGIPTKLSKKQNWCTSVTGRCQSRGSCGPLQVSPRCSRTAAARRMAKARVESGRYGKTCTMISGAGGRTFVRSCPCLRRTGELGSTTWAQEIHIPPDVAKEPRNPSIRPSHSHNTEFEFAGSMRHMLSGLPNFSFFHLHFMLDFGAHLMHLTV